MNDPYRTPGRVDPPEAWFSCGKCKRSMHPLNNARRIGDQIWCMPCYEAFFRTKRPWFLVKPLNSKC